MCSVLRVRSCCIEGITVSILPVGGRDAVVELEVLVLFSLVADADVVVVTGAAGEDAEAAAAPFSCFCCLGGIFT